MGIKYDRKRYTGGNIVVTTAAFADVNNGLDLTLSSVSIGDIVEVGISGLWSNEAEAGYLDIASVVSGSYVNSWAEAAAEGLGIVNNANSGLLGLLGQASLFSAFADSVPKKIVSGDLLNGSLLIRFIGKTAGAGDKTIFASATDPLIVYAINHGQ